MNPYIQQRIARAQALLQTSGLDAVVAASPANFFYFTDVWIEPHERLLAFVIPRDGDPVVFAPQMHEQDLQSCTVDKVLWRDGEDAIGLLAKSLPERGVVAIDNLWPSSNLIALLRHRPDIKPVESTQVLGRLRVIKDEYEVQRLRDVGARTDRVLERLVTHVQPGKSECALVEVLQSLWREEGVRQLSFAPIVATGPNGALPHHESDDTTVRTGDMVVIDMGAMYQHYCSDVTRTFAIGQASPQQHEVYDVVREAQRKAIETVRPGIPIGEVDRAARQVIEAAGYGAYFTHRTGHGLGIELHEEPYVHGDNTQLIEPGMVFSIEPGIYLPGAFGVRIEDIVIVTDDGCESVTKFPKDLRVL